MGSVCSLAEVSRPWDSRVRSGWMAYVCHAPPPGVLTSPAHLNLYFPPTRQRVRNCLAHFSFHSLADVRRSFVLLLSVLTAREGRGAMDSVESFEV